MLGKVVYAFNPANRLRLTWDHLDRDVDWNVLSAVAKPPLASTSTLALTAFDEMQRDRFTLDHRYDRDAAADRTRDATFDNVLRGATLEFSSLWDRGAVQHHFIYGADYSVTRQESTRDGTVPPAGETFPTHAFPTTDYSLAGIFLQDEIHISRLALYPAVRWDYFDNKTAHTIRKTRCGFCRGERCVAWLQRPVGSSPGRWRPADLFFRSGIQEGSRPGRPCT